MKQSTLGLYYEDFITGEIIIHELSKTIFESDNNLFSLLTSVLAFDIISP